MHSTETDAEAAVASLVAAELLVIKDGRLRTTRRWQGAMARAARQLFDAEAPFDPRMPIVCALLDIFGDTHPEQELIAEVRVLLQIEGEELGSASPRP
jgi:hypothetical protein